MCARHHRRKLYFMPTLVLVICRISKFGEEILNHGRAKKAKCERFLVTLSTLNFDLDLSKFNNGIWENCWISVPNFTITRFVLFKKSATNQPTNSHDQLIIMLVEFVFPKGETPWWTCMTLDWVWSYLTTMRLHQLVLLRNTAEAQADLNDNCKL